MAKHLSSFSSDGESAKMQVRLGIVGCGYVTSMSHLPASTLVDNVDIVALVDARLEQAQVLAQQYSVPFVTADYKELFEKVDAVILAIPHHLHMPVGVEFLSRGIHTLIEKPLALSVEECQELITTAEQSQAKLAVGHMRRFYDSNRLVKQLLDTHFLGEVLHFEAEEAVLFDNFKASPFTIFPPAGGVLFDTGTHVLDMLLWWFDDFKELAYWDDAIAGVEANCRIEVSTHDGVPGVIELSRTRHLANEIRVTCKNGTLKVSTLDPTQVIIESPNFSGPVTMESAERASGTLVPFFAHQLSNLAAAALGDEELWISGVEGMRNICVIERCRQVKQLLEIMPWMQLNEHVIRRIDSHE